jgi:hypothetical protein
MNLLLEAYLEHWGKNKDNSDLGSREKINALLSKAPDCPSWDWARALLACKMVRDITHIFLKQKILFYFFRLDLAKEKLKPLKNSDCTMISWK